MLLKQCEIKAQEVCLSIEGKSFEEKQKNIIKLHRKLAHLSTKNLKALSLECEISKMHIKTPLTSVMSLPLATLFNEVIAMDLRKCGGVYFLYLIDPFSRFCKSKVIQRKLSMSPLMV